MQSLTEQESNKQPTTPKEGAQAALFSVCEEVGQKLTAMDVSNRLLLNIIPENHPLRSRIESLAGITRRSLEILTKYRDAGFSGEFNFDVDRSGNPCLDIHPHSSTSLSKQQ